MSLDARSLARLEGVHPDLVRVIMRAAEGGALDFVVTEGLRTIERQQVLLAKGASRTMRSRHLTGHAVDLAVKIDGEIRWDWPLYHKLATIIKEAAADVGVPIEAGADWKKFPDGPHYQLPWRESP